MSAFTKSSPVCRENKPASKQQGRVDNTVVDSRVRVKNKNKRTHKKILTLHGLGERKRRRREKVKGFVRRRSLTEQRLTAAKPLQLSDWLHPPPQVRGSWVRHSASLCLSPHLLSAAENSTSSSWACGENWIMQTWHKPHLSAPVLLCMLGRTKVRTRSALIPPRTPKEASGIKLNSCFSAFPGDFDSPVTQI